MDQYFSETDTGFVACQYCKPMVEELLAVCRAAQWGGTSAPGNLDTPAVSSVSCPVCGGIAPSERPTGERLPGDWADEMYGHRTDCILAAALAKRRE